MRIEVRDGARSRSEVQPLFTRVYPDHVLEKIVWRNVISAPADRRVVLMNDANEIVASAGLIFRTGLRDGYPVRIGGVGGVLVSPELQRQGLGRTTMLAAHDVLRSCSDMQFGLLFCEPHNMVFYEGIGWNRFPGQVRVDQRGVSIIYDLMEAMTLDLETRAPRRGTIDVGGLPW